MPKSRPSPPMVPPSTSSPIRRGIRWHDQQPPVPRQVDKSHRLPRGLQGRLQAPQERTRQRGGPVVRTERRLEKVLEAATQHTPKYCGRRPSACTRLAGEPIRRHDSPPGGRWDEHTRRNRPIREDEADSEVVDQPHFKHRSSSRHSTRHSSSKPPLSKSSHQAPGSDGHKRKASQPSPLGSGHASKHSNKPKSY